MSSRLLLCLFLAGSCALPAAASGQTLPPLVAQSEVVVPRPSYRQAMRDFPPPGGRYGGGALEYLLTGGRPEPIAPRYRGVAAPQIGYVTPVPPYIHPVPKYPAYYHGHRLRVPHARHVYDPRFGYGVPVAIAPSPVGPLSGGLFAPLAYAPPPVGPVRQSSSQLALPAGGLPDYNPRATDFGG